MIKLIIEPDKYLYMPQNEDTFETENLISSFHIQLPSTFGNYPIKELTLEMRCYLPNTNGEYTEYMDYNVDTSKKCPEVPITNDITEQPQTIKIMFIASKDGNVIGKTNEIEKVILPAKLKGEPLTPRAEFDKAISKQRAEIAEQAATITQQETTIAEKNETITQQSSRITELNGEVTELQGEVAEKAATITRQNTTIDELNRRVPPLEVLDPINPTTEQVTYNPESPNIGFPQVIVNAPTAERLGFREDYYKKDEVFLNKVGTYDPFPEHSVGGIYITEVDENGYPVKILVKDYEKSPAAITTTSLINLNDSIANVTLQEVIYDNCPYYTTVSGSAFASCRGLRKIVLPQNITTFQNYVFDNCSALTEVVLPAKLQRIAEGAFRNCTSLETIVFPHGFLGTSGSLGAPPIFYLCPALKNVYLPNTMISLGPPLFYTGDSALEFITLESGFNCNNLNLSTSTLYSHDTILSWFNALADRTGETAYTLTIGSTNLNKMTAEEKAIAINKNWNLA